jgi:hypothetical protein
MGTRMLADSGAPVISGAAGILADWGVAPRSAKTDRFFEHAGNAIGGYADAEGNAIGGYADAGQDGAEPGSSIARRVRAEIEGSCATRSGETYWRGS